jgi:spore maturation protein CgeB
MGTSGTVMVTEQNPLLEEYYEPQKEYWPFENLEECADIVRYLLSHEAERKRIAQNYLRRTKSEHLWVSRFRQLFREIGV